MKNESQTPQINELNEKMQYLDELLKKDLFSNPLRDVQENIRNELIEFREIFCKNLNELENYVENAEKNSQVVVQNVSSEETVPKKNLERKEYQVEILKNAFTDYEQKTVLFNYLYFSKTN